MFPWLYFWAPQFYYPFSGSVAQRIEPDTNWFFDSIIPTAGDGQIEKKACEVASYGRQLGLITEVLTEIADKVKPTSEEARDSLQRLKDIRSEIENLKQVDASTLVRDIEDRAARLKRRHKARYPQLREKLERTLAEDDA